MRFHLSPVQFEFPSDLRNNGVASPTFSDGGYLTISLKAPDGDAQFMVDNEETLRTANVSPDIGRASSKSRIVEYQRVCIGGNDVSGVRFSKNFAAILSRLVDYRLSYLEIYVKIVKLLHKHNLFTIYPKLVLSFEFFLLLSL